MSHEQFVTYWRDVHAPLVRANASALGMVGYFQIHTVHEGANRGLQAARHGPDPYDGIAEAWFEDLESTLERFSSDEGRAAWLLLAEDEGRFIDLANSPIFFGEALTIIDPATRATG